MFISEFSDSVLERVLYKSTIATSNRQIGPTCTFLQRTVARVVNKQQKLASFGVFVMFETFKILLREDFFNCIGHGFFT
jgi:hypothetical protein